MSDFDPLADSEAMSNATAELRKCFEETDGDAFYSELAGAAVSGFLAISVEARRDAVSEGRQDAIRECADDLAVALGYEPGRHSWDFLIQAVRIRGPREPREQTDSRPTFLTFRSSACLLDHHARCDGTTKDWVCTCDCHPVPETSEQSS